MGRRDRANRVQAANVAVLFVTSDFLDVDQADTRSLSPERPKTPHAPARQAALGTLPTGPRRRFHGIRALSLERPNPFRPWGADLVFIHLFLLRMDVALAGRKRKGLGVYGGSF